MVVCHGIKKDLWAEAVDCVVTGGSRHFLLTMLSKIATTWTKKESLYITRFLMNPTKLQGKYKPLAAPHFQAGYPLLSLTYVLAAVTTVPVLF